MQDREGVIARAKSGCEHTERQVNAAETGIAEARAEREKLEKGAAASAARSQELARQEEALEEQRSEAAAQRLREELRGLLEERQQALVDLDAATAALAPLAERLKSLDRRADELRADLANVRPGYRAQETVPLIPWGEGLGPALAAVARHGDARKVKV